MLPGFIARDRKPSPAKQVAKGLYVVQDAYEGNYDFFESSPLTMASDVSPQDLRDAQAEILEGEIAEAPAAVNEAPTSHKAY